MSTTDSTTRQVADAVIQKWVTYADQNLAPEDVPATVIPQIIQRQLGLPADRLDAIDRIFMNEMLEAVARVVSQVSAL